MTQQTTFSKNFRTWKLERGLHMRPEEILLYGIDKQETDPLNYIGYDYFDKVIRPTLNDPHARALTDNKWIFYALARAHGLSIPPTIALFDRMYGITANGQPCTSVACLREVLTQSRPSGLVVKPAGGIQGRGVIIFENIDWGGDGSAVLRTGRKVSLWEEIGTLPDYRSSTGAGYVIQEAVSQHESLEEINPHTTNTLRIVTHLTRADEVRIPFAVIRLGRSGNMVDNWEQGGISVGIDIESGRMTHGALKPKYGGGWVESHPDTGIDFTGRYVPYWSEAVSLCRQAALLIPAVRSIGWDLIISQKGPVLLEANEKWDLIMVQLHTSGWLAVPGIREDLEGYGIGLPTTPPSVLDIGREVTRRKLAKIGRRMNRTFQPTSGN